MVQPSVLFAEDGDPLAVRCWPEGMVSVETQWGLQLVINPTEHALDRLSRRPDATIETSQEFDQVLFRRANESKPSWLPNAEYKPDDPNAIRAKTIRLSGDGTNPVLVEVDGVRIVFVSQDSLQNKVLIPWPEMDSIDLLVWMASAKESFADSLASSVVAELKPQRVLLSPVIRMNPTELEKFSTAISANAKISALNHNTLAISKSTESSSHSQLITLTEKPWEMPGDLAEMFAAMEQANLQSQSVFKNLSVDQLNFKPTNGTHTARWNCEHMMGRQLLFFSQIYHTIDSAIPVRDLNPKQMPPDYEFAHPDWDGAEEARQMQRVSDFTRRFAYLLADVPLNQKAPGSRWPSLDALLKQMQRHYGEHTANTVKKFELPDWPQK